MGDRGKWRLFRDEGKYLDHFCLVLVLAAISVSVLALVDLDGSDGRLSTGAARVIVSFTAGVTLLVSLRVSGVTRRWQRVASVVIGVTLAATVAFLVLSRFVDLDSSIDPARIGLIWAAIAFVSPMVLLRRVLSHTVVTAETLFGAVAVYLLMALGFNFVFLELGRFGSGPFFGTVEPSTSFMYFSLVTITTLGYGDLAAVSNLGRFAATREAIIGQVFLVTIVARMVSVYSRPLPTPSSDRVTGQPELE